MRRKGNFFRVIMFSPLRNQVKPERLKEDGPTNNNTSKKMSAMTEVERPQSRWLGLILGLILDVDVDHEVGVGLGAL